MSLIRIFLSCICLGMAGFFTDLSGCDCKECKCSEHANCGCFGGKKCSCSKKCECTASFTGEPVDASS